MRKENRKYRRILTIPLLDYIPETKLIVGIEVYTPSSIPVAALYTQNKQYQVALIPEFYSNLAFTLALRKFSEEQCSSAGSEACRDR
jgi:hypothetical protein